MADYVESKYIIRNVERTELEEAFALVWKVFQKFVAPDYTQEGIDFFYTQFIDSEEFKKKFETGEQIMYGAFDENRIVGILSISTNNHVSCAFVDESYQRKGIASNLFRHVIRELKARGADEISLNASPYGVPFYHAIGFQDMDVYSDFHGIYYTPMKLSI